MVVVIGLYFLMFERLGYVISTSLFLWLTTSYFNRGKTMANVCTSLGYSGASDYLFSVLLGVNLPHGLLPF
jgi:putative tricarboxylic transport membrane protein